MVWEPGKNTADDDRPMIGYVGPMYLLSAYGLPVYDIIKESRVPVARRRLRGFGRFSALI